MTHEDDIRRVKREPPNTSEETKDVMPPTTKEDVLKYAIEAPREERALQNMSKQTKTVFIVIERE